MDNNQTRPDRKILGKVRDCRDDLFVVHHRQPYLCLRFCTMSLQQGNLTLKKNFINSYNLLVGLFHCQKGKSYLLGYNIQLIHTLQSPVVIFLFSFLFCSPFHPEAYLC